MKCTDCGLREATTEAVIRSNGHMEKMFLCDECAKKYSPDMGLGGFDMINKLINSSPMGILSSFNNLFDPHASRTLVCPDCNTTSEEFLKTGFVGCPKCYKVFEPLVVQTVKKLQQSDRHIGKSPHGAGETPTEAQLKEDLKAAMEIGDYAKLTELGEQLKRIVGNKREDD